MKERSLIVESERETSSSALSPRDSEQLAGLRSAWADCVEREKFSRQAITNLANQISELDLCISDSRLQAAAPIPIGTDIQGITEHSRKKRIAQDEIEALQDAKSELLKQLSRLESEFRGYSLEKSGVKESLFRLHFNDILSKNKPLFARIAALGLQLGLTEQMLIGELFYSGCGEDNLNDLITELGILS